MLYWPGSYSLHAGGHTGETSEVLILGAPATWGVAADLERRMDLFRPPCFHKASACANSWHRLCSKKPQDVPAVGGSRKHTSKAFSRATTLARRSPKYSPT